MNDHSKGLVEAIARSRIYRDYERAFSDATGLPVTFRAVDSWQLPLRGQPNENRFCAYVSQKSRSCAVCLQVQQELAEKAQFSPATVDCPSGLCESAVPVRLGDRLIGFLQTGQVFRRKPTRAQIQKTKEWAVEWKLDIDPDEIAEAYRGTRVLGPKEQDAVIRLLAIFADHLGIICNQIIVQQTNAEPPVITRAKEFIQQHYTEDLSLGQVAKAVNTSTFYFCKIFKKATGINFTDYVSRVRVEHARNLLLNPNLRVSEIAYEVGFQSLTHFNRVFKRIVGRSPTEYRSKLPTV